MGREKKENISSAPSRLFVLFSSFCFPNRSFFFLLLLVARLFRLCVKRSARLKKRADLKERERKKKKKEKEKKVEVEKAKEKIHFFTILKNKLLHHPSVTPLPTHSLALGASNNPA